MINTAGFKKWRITSGIIRTNNLSIFDIIHTDKIICNTEPLYVINKTGNPKYWVYPVALPAFTIVTQSGYNKKQANNIAKTGSVLNFLAEV